jgi:hypothetical protein
MPRALGNLLGREASFERFKTPNRIANPPSLHNQLAQLFFLLLFASSYPKQTSSRLTHLYIDKSHPPQDQVILTSFHHNGGKQQAHIGSQGPLRGHGSSGRRHEVLD